MWIILRTIEFVASRGFACILGHHAKGSVEFKLRFYGLLAGLFPGYRRGSAQVLRDNSSKGLARKKTGVVYPFKRAWKTVASASRCHHRREFGSSTARCVMRCHAWTTPARHRSDQAAQLSGNGWFFIMQALPGQLDNTSVALSDFSHIMRVRR